MTYGLASRCKNIVKKDVNCQKITKFALFSGQANAIDKIIKKRMFIISIQSKLNTTGFLFTLGGYHQYFDVQMQKYSERGRKLPKNYKICAIQRPRCCHLGNFIKECLAYLYSPNLILLFFTLHQGAMTNILSSRCKKIVKNDVNFQKLHNKCYLVAKVVPQAKFYEIIISISIQPQNNNTVLLFTLGGYD